MSAMRTRNAARRSFGSTRNHRGMVSRGPETGRAAAGPETSSASAIVSVVSVVSGSRKGRREVRREALSVYRIESRKCRLPETGPRPRSPLHSTRAPSATRGYPGSRRPPLDPARTLLAAARGGTGPRLAARPVPCLPCPAHAHPRGAGAIEQPPRRKPRPQAFFRAVGERIRQS